LTHVADGPHHVRRFRVGADGALSGGEVFATCPVGLYDGLRVDVHGNLWLSAGDGVHCHAPDGDLLGKVLVPESVANLCFGGAKRNRMFICGNDLALLGLPEYPRGALGAAGRGHLREVVEHAVPAVRRAERFAHRQRVAAVGLEAAVLEIDPGRPAGRSR
jgi:hypothetical protein